MTDMMDDLIGRQMDHLGPCAEVAVKRPFANGLSYLIPKELQGILQSGMLVEVPLGSSLEIGCVISIATTPDLAEQGWNIKPIKRVVSTGFFLNEEIINLGRWVADYYFCSLGEVLSAASLLGFSDVERVTRTVYTLSGANGLSLTSKQSVALNSLATSGITQFDSQVEMARTANCSSAIIKALVDRGALQSEVTADIPPIPIPPKDTPPKLSAQQSAALESIIPCVAESRFQVFLLHGVTGSGKTEVYLRLIEEAFRLGKTALCLVPEISLTPQAVERFTSRFGEEVGVIHSQLTKSDKRMLYDKIIGGKIRLVIGARSASFAPLPRLGVIIIDEEHESSYKQGESPRYHAREVLIMRANKLSIPIILGSATPSLDSYENCMKGKFTLLKLTERPAGLQMPTVKLIPMGEASGAGTPEQISTSLFTPELQAAIAERLKKGEQTILFLNRRGFSNFLMCPSCKWVARCEHDDITLTIHRRNNRREPDNKIEELDLFPKPLHRDDAVLRCHFCGQFHDYPKSCPECGETELVGLGTGTQRIEEALQRLYPDTNILRLDQDTVSGRQAFLSAWQKMVSGEAQIILGTQMIAKGLHLERVTLVGVILADVGLFIPDFRAEERTFSLLMQVAGRAGRVNMGEVLLQTYMPHHAAINLAARHDYEGFFAAEMIRRRKMRFPPCERLVSLTISDIDLQRTEFFARTLAQLLRKTVHQLREPMPVIIGPQPAPIARLGGRFRARILLRCESNRQNTQLLRKTLALPEWNPPSGVRLAIDVDPQDLL